MAAPAPTYDLVLILDPSSEDEARSAVVADVTRRLERGEVAVVRDWGVRQLAYPIDHKTHGEYHLFRFRGPADLLAELDRTLRIADAVIRHRVIELGPSPLDPPDLASPEPVAAAPAPVADEPA